MSDAETLLSVDNLVVRYRGPRRRPVTALKGVTLAMRPRQTVGIAGESGSGKSTLGKAILGLVPVAEGTITFEGTDITRTGRQERKALSRDIQAIFQDPYGSLNPTLRVGGTLAGPMRVQDGPRRDDVRDRVAEVLRQVGLPADMQKRYPAELSGGQRQRIAVARVTASRGPREPGL